MCGFVLLVVVVVTVALASDLNCGAKLCATVCGAELDLGDSVTGNPAAVAAVVAAAGSLKAGVTDSLPSLFEAVVARKFVNNGFEVSSERSL